MPYVNIAITREGATPALLCGNLSPSPADRGRQAAVAVGIAACASVFCQAGSALSDACQRLISP